MDSSVWISLIGICGTLGGALFGAWLNPYMQEKKEIKRLKRKLKEASLLDKFIIFNAYRNVYLPLHKMTIYPNPQLSLDNQQLINYFNETISNLELHIRRMDSEKILFAKDEYYSGYRLALSSEFSFLINRDSRILDMMIVANKQFIKETIYPLYEKIIKSVAIFQIVQQSQQMSQQQTTTISTNKLMDISLFMHNIGVFSIFMKDLSYLNPTSPKTYLNFPKGEFHPEYKV